MLHLYNTIACSSKRTWQLRHMECQARAAASGLRVAEA